MLRFSVGTIPVRIQASVLLVGGYVYLTSRSLPTAVVWTLALVVTVLTHELGHALVVRRVGGDPAVTVWALGGYTAWIPTPTTTWRHRFLIAASGSLLQFIVAAGLWLAAGAGWLGPALASAIGTDPFRLPPAAFSENIALGLTALVVYFGMVWSLFNWIPIAGLDGSHMLEAAISRRAGTATARRVASVVSLVVAVALAGWLLWRGDRVLAVFVLIIAAGGLR